MFSSLISTVQSLLAGQISAIAAGGIALLESPKNDSSSVEPCPGSDRV